MGKDRKTDIEKRNGVCRYRGFSLGVDVLGTTGLPCPRCYLVEQMTFHPIRRFVLSDESRLLCEPLSVPQGVLINEWWYSDDHCVNVNDRGTLFFAG